MTLTTNETTLTYEKRVGCYKIGETLGEGSFAKVKLGTHEKTGERVALKVGQTPRTDFLTIFQFISHEANAESLDVIKLKREIDIQRKVEHANIAKLLEVIEVADDRTCLVMELVEGRDLIDVLEAYPERRIPEKEARKIFRQIASAIQYLHEHGIVHRDIKLENVMFSHDGSCKLIDFGFASHWSMTRALETPCGSANYAAPEILLRQPYRGPKTDVWGLGVLLYCMIRGRIPWAGETAREQLYNTVQGKWTEIEDASKPLIVLISGCLLPDQESRYGIYDVTESEWVREGRRAVIKRKLSGTIKNITAQADPDWPSGHVKLTPITSYHCGSRLTNTLKGLISSESTTSPGQRSLNDIICQIDSRARTVFPRCSHTARAAVDDFHPTSTPARIIDEYHMTLTTDETMRSHEKRVGYYKIGETLGEGSFAKVKLGTHERVALKVGQTPRTDFLTIFQFISHEADVGSLSVIKLKREIDIQRKVEHANITKLLVFVTHANCFLTEVTRARKIFRQITSAIQYLHEHGIVHRDIKLENVMLSHDGTCKLIDFGFASHWSMSQALKTPCGSTIYAAPEILLRQAYRGPKTDVWGLGVLLYCTISGQVPWAGETAREQLYNTVQGRWTEIDGVSDSLSDLIHGCLLTEQESRYGYPWKMLPYTVTQHTSMEDSKSKSKSPVPPVTFSPTSSGKEERSPDASKSPRSRSSQDSGSDDDILDLDEEEVKSPRSGKKPSWILSQKKALASRASTSTVGQGLLNKMLDKETKTLLKTVRTIAKKEQGEKFADRLHKDITKLAVKIVLLHKEQRVTDEAFNAMEFSLRRIFSATRNAYRNRKLDEGTIQRIVGHVAHLHEHIKLTHARGMISPWVSDHTIQRLKRVIEYLGSPTLLAKLPSYPEEYKEIVFAFDHYLGVME
ncbi:hypothetical protein PROFUN_07381 [Planoprotostelium fungivorum]|uniref:non-specific serine/threonine protein kinase n=1 Tax=Planoprotostelium fungivorum TaxID=1890364 RepID=A0A2P6MTF6_9EUKA|nr:hypothetical protein PROFUN_07381 [Planoprotostelium fungivorum]